jgi:hypothetical protein
MVQLRQGPSGPPIVGDNIGDILIWNGTEWVPGPQSGGGSSAFLSQFAEDQTLNLEIVEDIFGAEVTYNTVPAGALVFVQCVINTTITLGAGFINPRVVWDFGSGDEVFWEPGPVLWEGEGENPSFDKLPMQFQTPPLIAPAASVNVRIQANGQGRVFSGHFRSELILP